MNRRQLIKSLLALPAIPLAETLATVPEDNLTIGVDVAKHASEMTLMTVWEAKSDGTFISHGSYEIELPAQLPTKDFLIRGGNRWGKSAMMEEWMKLNLTQPA